MEYGQNVGLGKYFIEDEDDVVFQSHNETTSNGRLAPAWMLLLPSWRPSGTFENRSRGRRQRQRRDRGGKVAVRFFFFVGVVVIVVVVIIINNGDVRSYFFHPRNLILQPRVDLQRSNQLTNGIYPLTRSELRFGDGVTVGVSI